MSVKIIKFTTKEKQLFDEACKIRIKVFVDEQKVTHEEEFDGLDDDAVHYLAYFNEQVAGTGRYRLINNVYKLERFAVSKDFRGKNVGANILKAMLKDILPTSKTIYLNSQVSAQDFYKKYGFEKEGERFIEANIEHYKMVYKN